jgi:hypothetical protein
MKLCSVADPVPKFFHSRSWIRILHTCGSRLRAVPHSAEWTRKFRLIFQAELHSAKSWMNFVAKTKPGLGRVDFCNRISSQILVYTVFETLSVHATPWIRGPRGIVSRKNRGSKISWYCPLTFKIFRFHESKLNFETWYHVSGIRDPRARIRDRDSGINHPGSRG